MSLESFMTTDSHNSNGNGANPDRPVGDYGTDARRRNWISWALFRAPLYVRILIALPLGAIAGVSFGARMAHVALPAQIVIQFLNAIAPPMIMLAVIRALV